MAKLVPVSGLCMLLDAPATGARRALGSVVPVLGSFVTLISVLTVIMTDCRLRLPTHIDIWGCPVES